MKLSEDELGALRAEVRKGVTDALGPLREMAQSLERTLRRANDVLDQIRVQARKRGCPTLGCCLDIDHVGSCLLRFTVGESGELEPASGSSRPR